MIILIMIKPHHIIIMTPLIIISSTTSIITPYQQTISPWWFIYLNYCTHKEYATIAAVLPPHMWIFWEITCVFTPPPFSQLHDLLVLHFFHDEQPQCHGMNFEIQQQPMSTATWTKQYKNHIPNKQTKQINNTVSINQLRTVEFRMLLRSLFVHKLNDFPPFSRVLFLCSWSPPHLSPSHS